MPTPLDIAYLTALGVTSPWIARRLITSSKGRASLREKLTGNISLPVKTRPRVWFHGVSVGEIHLLRTLLERFARRRPDCEAIISSTTETGLVEARRCFPTLAVVPWPMDFSWAVRRAVDRIQPDLVVLAESELWPGMLSATKRAQVPVVVVNGRLSPTSAKHWRMAKPLSRMLFDRIARFAMQTAEYGENLRRLGVPSDRIVVTGSVKYDGVETDRNNPGTVSLRDLFQLTPNDTVWVAGSTQAPEEQGCLRVYQQLLKRNPQLRLILVPRQKERFDEVAARIAQSGVPFVRRSQLPATYPPGAVILVDTIGELRAVWGLADIAFVGGSLDGQRGGQNMIEPAAYGAAVVFGHHVWNFRATAEQLVACGGARQVNSFDEMSSAVNSMLQPEVRQVFGEKARTFVLSQQGATERTLDVLDEVLGLSAPLRKASASRLNSLPPRRG